MDDVVAADEQITRFLVHSNEFRRGQNRVDYAAFMPDQRGEKSVYRTSGLNAEQIRDIGFQHVENENRRMKGEGRVLARAIFAAGLTVEPAPKPHPRHANIRGYQSERAANRNAAQKIAQAAELVLYDLPHEQR